MPAQTQSDDPRVAQFENAIAAIEATRRELQTTRDRLETLRAGLGETLRDLARDGPLGEREAEAIEAALQAGQFQRARQLVDDATDDVDRGEGIEPDGGSSPTTCDFCGLDHGTVRSAMECCSGVVGLTEPTVAADGGRRDRAHQLERIAHAQERQADALEAIAGMAMVAFDYDEEMPDYSVEALYEEELFHGRGGER